MKIELSSQQIAFIEHLSKFYFENNKSIGLIDCIANQGLLDAIHEAKKIG